MTLTPALSWMHLFPRGTTFECDESAPAWMRAQIEAMKTGASDSSRFPCPGNRHPEPYPAKDLGRNTPVCSRDSSRSAARNDGRQEAASIVKSDTQRVRVSSAASSDGDPFVAINCKIDEWKLALDGYAYVRRFAVLPDLKTARWFVPLDCPAVSTAGFALYSPARFSAKLKVAAAKMAAYSRIPIWYRDSLVIAQRTPPPIGRKMAQLFDGASFRLALSSGAPEPARNRKVSLAIIGMDGRILGFAKAAHSELSQQLMRDEAKALSELSRRNIAAPPLLFCGDVDGTYITAQKPLKGKPVSTALNEAKARLLISLRSPHPRAAIESNLVSSLPARLTQIANSELHDAFDDIHSILAEMRVPATIIHGDFAPWNLREHGGQVAAFDWEYAELDGLPYFDEIHYRLQVGYLLENWDLNRALAELKRMQAANDLSLRPEQMRAIQVVYLVDNLARLFAEGYDAAENDMVGWYCQLLAALSPSRKAVAAA